MALSVIASIHSLLVINMQLSLVLQKPPDRGYLAQHHCYRQSCHSYPIGEVDVCSSRKEFLCHLEVLVQGVSHEGSQLIRVLEVDVVAHQGQVGNDLVLLLLRRQSERVEAVLIPGRVQVDPCLAHDLYRPAGSILDCREDGGEVHPLVVLEVDQGSVLHEELHAVQVIHFDG